MGRLVLPGTAAEYTMLQITWITALNTVVSRGEHAKENCTIDAN
jgi:hypothetical protein